MPQRPRRQPVHQPGGVQQIGGKQFTGIKCSRGVTNRKARIDINLVAGEEKLPKTAAGVRDVDLSDDAISALIAQKQASFEAGQQIWLNPRTGEPWKTDAQIRKTLWQPLCTRAGVRYRNPYQCRHTFASALLTEGANPW